MKDKIDEMIKSLDTWHSDKVRGHKVYFADAVLEGLNDLFPKCQNNNIKDSPQSNLELVKGERNNSSEDTHSQTLCRKCEELDNPFYCPVCNGFFKKLHKCEDKQ